MMDLGAGFYFNSDAYDINDFGMIVGLRSTFSQEDAFLYYNGFMMNLDWFLPPNSGWHLITATGINNAGQIVGTGVNPNGEFHAYLLDTQGVYFATPEPGTLFATGLGLLLLGALRRR